MTPKLWVFTIVKDERHRIEWFLKHYLPISERIIVFDEQSTDGTREVLKQHPKVDLREWPHRGLDDEAFIYAVNTEYRQARGHADWVAWPDVDELLYHPQFLRVLAEATEDVIRSTGYALIPKVDPPDQVPGIFPKEAPHQIYDEVRTGIRQPNYDKLIVWRPTIEIKQQIGRHPGNGYPQTNGKLGSHSKLKLLHTHHVGGIAYTTKLNARNYTRANNKKFAWNYTEAHNIPSQVGSVAWVEDAIQNGKLVDVMAMTDYSIGETMPPLKRIQFCSGDNKLPGWINHDIDCDISRSLPYADGIASHLLIEHGLEHVSHQQAWNFLEEAFRILVPGGVLRVAIPDITKLSREMIPEYLSAVGPGATPQSAIKAAVFNHGHQAAWNAQLLITILQAIGFMPRLASYRKSIDPVLNNVEGHWMVVGEKVASVETSCIEAVKP